MKYLLFFNLLILPSVIGAQDGWITQNSHTTSHLNSVYFIDNSMGWMAGEDRLGRGIILQTMNSGLNWTYQYIEGSNVTVTWCRKSFPKWISIQNF